MRNIVHKPYCDDIEVKKILLKTKPTDCGLYPHEIVFLWYATFRKISTTDTIIKNEWCYNVNYVELLFESLLNRGYLRISNDRDLKNFIDILDNNELHKILKKKYKKIPVKKADKILLLKSLTDEQLSELIEESFYIPTQKALEAIDDNRLIIDNRWHIWSESFRDEHSLTANDSVEGIPLVKVKNIEISFFDEKIYIRFNQSAIKYLCPEKYQFNNLVMATVQFDNGKFETFTITNLISLSNSDMILVRKKNKKEYQCMIVNNNGVKYREIVDRNPMTVQQFDESIIYQIDKKRNYNKNNMQIFLKQDLHLFFSIRSPMIIKVLEDSRISKTIERINGVTDTDYSCNVCLKVDSSNTFALDIITFLVRTKYIDTIKLFGVPINIFLNELSKNSFNNKIDRIIVCERLKNELNENYSNTEELIKYVSNYLSIDLFVDNLCKTYPYEFLRNSISTILQKINLKSDYVFYSLSKTKDEKYKQIDNKNREEFYKIVQNVYISREKAPQWKNEFNLFELFFEHFDDAIFQYRSEWLSHQSLDIYIPSKRVAVEYQGKQHYEPVGFFGGEQGFEKTRERDIRKKKLCNEQGINLLYWSYDVPVTIENFRIFIKNI